MKRLRLESKKGKLLSRQAFWIRVCWYALFASLFLAVSLGVGTLGYHMLAGQSWVDAFLNASMILTGMGPVDRLETDAAKVFASCYAIYSGVSFLTFCGVLFTPFYHRFLHQFHLEMRESEK